MVKPTSSIRDGWVCGTKTSSIKVCFYGNANNSQRMRVSKNGKVQHSYFRLQKFAKHAQGFGSVVNCSRDVGNVRKKKRRKKKKKSCRTKNNSRVCLANFWSLKCKCWTFQFFYICILRESFMFPSKHTLYWPPFPIHYDVSLNAIRVGSTGKWTRLGVSSKYQIMPLNLPYPRSAKQCFERGWGISNEMLGFMLRTHISQI